MIYAVNNSKSLNYKTPLLDYLKITNNYSMEKLSFSTKYSSGTFTVASPSLNFKNCEYINGYPHFNIPFDVCRDEISFFLNDYSLYSNDFII